MIGIVGLKGTFEELARDGVDQADVALSRMLLERLSEKIYTPENVREITAGPLSGNSESFSAMLLKMEVPKDLL